MLGYCDTPSQILFHTINEGFLCERLLRHILIKAVFRYWLSAGTSDSLSVHILQNGELSPALWHLSGAPCDSWDVAEVTISSPAKFRASFPILYYFLLVIMFLLFFLSSCIITEKKISSHKVPVF